MQPTRPRSKYGQRCCDDTLASGPVPATLVGFASSRSRTVFTKTEALASLDALAVLGTSRRKVRVLRTVFPPYCSNGSGSSSCSR